MKTKTCYETHTNCNGNFCKIEERKNRKSLESAAPALLEACRSGLRVALAHAADCAPDFALKTGESADYDAAMIMVNLFRDAIAKASA